MTSPILVAHHDPTEIESTLTRRHPATQFEFAVDAEQLAEQLSSLQPTVVFSLKCERFPPAGHRQIVDCPSVRWIQVAGSGYEHLGDWDPATLTVTNCAGVLAPYLAETIMGAMITINEHFLDYRQQQQDRVWNRKRFRPLAGKTLLIVGLGHIGQQVADRAKAFGMRVVGIRRQPKPHPSVDLVATPDQLSELVCEADVVSVHVRLSAATESLFDGDMLRRMKSDAIFMNTSRGKVVDEAALIQVLDSGHLRGAFLDVFQQEPLPNHSPLWSLDNVLLTPHVADNVNDWPVIFAEYFADNLALYRNRQPLKNVVKP